MDISNSIEKLDKKTIDKSVYGGLALVCDNNPMNLAIICEHLRKAGLNPIIAVDGDDCVRIVRERARKYLYTKDKIKQFDLILIDVHKPSINGLETSVKVRGIDRDVPIIALTDDIFIENRMTYRDYGIVDCLGKPFRKQDLLYCVQKYVTPVNM